MNDYSDELKLDKNPWKRRLWTFFGTFFLVLAIIGVFLPLLPTTPFLLLTATCYARGSARFYHWLMNHSHLGPYIRDWRDQKGIPLKGKVLAILLIAITMGTTIHFYIHFVPAKWAMAFVAVGVSTYLVLQPTRR